MKKRFNQILELLTKSGRLEVSVLAERLNVSAVTIRKDLAALEKQGIITREHGYALLKSPDNLDGRIAYHYDNKKKIAARAAQYVRDGDTIMIESGSCCALLADELAGRCKDLTIITNSIYIARRLRSNASFKIILPGGIYQNEAEVLVGPMVKAGIANLYADRLFIGTDGYSDQTGFTNRDPMRAQAVRDMAGHAEKIIVLTESEKFRHHGTIPIQSGHQSVSVITDAGIPEEAAASLQEKQIQLIALPASDPDESES